MLSRKRTQPGRRRAMLGALAAAVAPTPGALAQPAADLWQRWTRHDDSNGAKVDHSTWQNFVVRYAKVGADGVVRLPYGRIAAEDRRSLDGYLDFLAKVPISQFARVEQLAYWINFYNALTVKIVLDRYPVKSIRDIALGGSLTSKLFGGPWDAKLVRVEGEPVSLNDMEHRILRPIWRDPRIHYAVNCASIGCPPLRRVAFSAGNASGLMDAAGREYVNGPHGVRRDGNRIWVSSIYRWFREDFGGTEAGVLAHLARYATGDLASTLGAVRRIEGDYYDWSLNDLT